jgi:hypothetical protein
MTLPHMQRRAVRDRLRWNASSSTRWKTTRLLSAPEARKTNQSPPLKPAESNDAKQSSPDSRRLGNLDCSQLDVVDNELPIIAI